MMESLEGSVRDDRTLEYVEDMLEQLARLARDAGDAALSRAIHTTAQARRAPSCERSPLAGAA